MLSPFFPSLFLFSFSCNHCLPDKISIFSGAVAGFVCTRGCFYCTENGQENSPTRVRGQEAAAPESRRTRDHSTRTHSAVGQHVRRVRQGKRFIAQRTASSGCGHRASKQAAWERKPSVRERREDPAFQQVWQQRALRPGQVQQTGPVPAPTGTQLLWAGMGNEDCPAINTLVWLLREEVPADGESLQVQEAIPPDPPREAPLHHAPVAKDGPVSQGRQPLGICSLPSNGYIQHRRLQFQLHDTSSHQDNLSSRPTVLLGHISGNCLSLHEILRR